MHKFVTRFGVAFAVVAGLIGVASASAFAQTYTVPADPTAGGAQALLSGVGTWIVTYGAPMIVGLVLLGLLVRVFIKMARKAGGVV